MDAIDARIIRALQRNGRLTNLELAEGSGPVAVALPAPGAQS